MNQEKKPKRSVAKRGLMLTTAVATAAGLVGAALLYLRKKGISPKEGAKTLSTRAKSAGAIFKGESRAAYIEIHDAIVQELVDAEGPVTKQSVHRTIDRVLRALKAHGDMTKSELRLLGDQLKADWKGLQKTAQGQKRV